MAFIAVKGTKFIQAGEEGEREITLRGAGLGGWMTMENFITGFPGCEFQVREALEDVLGPEKAGYFFDKFLEYFFADDDAKFFHSLGSNCIRIAVNYRHFEDDLNPRVLKPDAFKHLDRAISLCAKYSIYTVIDMHTAQGGQSGGWHCDSGTHLAYFWRHKDFQDRFVWLWSQIASHYAGNPWVAGYNVLNEPADPHPTHSGLINVYDRACAAIREVDSRHILFLDGNTFATDFTKFPEDVATRWGDNVAFAIHDYSTFGFPKYKGRYESTPEQRKTMEESYRRKRKWLDDRELCVWNGEWGPVYARAEYDGDATEDINRQRYQVLEDQLQIYKEDKLSWSIWLYKDIGYQGMIFVSRGTKYMELFRDFLAKKQRLAIDAWGADDRAVRHIYDPLCRLIREETIERYQKLYPPIWSVDERVTRISRTILVAEYFVQEWAETFRGMETAALDELAQSFRFQNCVKREGLNKILQESTRA